MNEKLAALLEGGAIARYHIKGRNKINQQNVAEHSWRMAAVLHYLKPDARPELIWALLFHDVSERITGDVPSPVKWNNPAIAAALNQISTNEELRLGVRFVLFSEEAKLLRWLDLYEGVLHCLDELEMGNRKIIGTLRRYLKAATDPMRALADPAVEVLRLDLCKQAATKAEFLINEDQP